MSIFHISARSQIYIVTLVYVAGRLYEKFFLKLKCLLWERFKDLVTDTVKMKGISLLFCACRANINAN